MTLIDVIKPYIDHYHEIDGINFRKSTFIFLRYCQSIFGVIFFLLLRLMKRDFFVVEV
jgi:hypothetical protein